MPIDCPIAIAQLGPNEFEDIDYRVMGHAFASQNDLGRLCDEVVYQSDLKARLGADGFRSVHTEVPVLVTHSDFSKKYYLDLVADSALYELKADRSLAGEHETQLLNYLLLIGLPRGKLLNFRPGRVEGKIIATSLNPSERRKFEVSSDRWSQVTPECEALRKIMCDLLSDWGTFLDTNLYQEALIHFLGGASQVEKQVRLVKSGQSLGQQRLLLHAPGVAFRITAFTTHCDSIQSHLQRLLALTSLKALQWINLNHARIEFVTLENKPLVEISSRRNIFSHSPDNHSPDTSHV